MKDLTALRTLLESDATYTADVEGGSNSALLALLNGDDATGSVGVEVARTELLAAIGDGMRLLTGDALAKLRLLMGENDTVDMRKAEVRQEVTQIFTGQAAVLTRVQAVSARQRKRIEAVAGWDEPVSLADLWEVLPQIPTSHHAKYLAGTLGE